MLKPEYIANGLTYFHQTLLKTYPECQLSNTKASFGFRHAYVLDRLVLKLIFLVLGSNK